MILWAFLAFSLASETPARATEFDHSGWDRVLKQHVTEDGRVDYAAIRENPAELKAYLAAVAARSPASHPNDFPTREAQLAYWINAYNALVFHGVVEAWPVKSVRDIGTLPYSFFWRKKFPVGGRKYTLNGIEDILRKQFGEPRVHFVLVCAAKSCPILERQAFTAENVEELLEKNTRAFINDPRNLKIDAAANRVTVARIFTFYDGDFKAFVRARVPGSTGHPTLAYIRIYASDANGRALDALKNPKVNDFEYDWGINAANAAAASDTRSKGGLP